VQVQDQVQKGFHKSTLLRFAVVGRQINHLQTQIQIQIQNQKIAN